MTDSCVFCKIVRGEFGTEFVAESERAVAFNDISPMAPVHVLVVPKQHVSALQELDDPALAGELLTLARKVAEKTGVAETGYRVVTNNGEQAGQTVFHLHFHVLGGRKLSTGLA